jgi:hypothetical protein
MKARSLGKRRLRVEELEKRLVLSVVPGLEGDASLAAEHLAAAAASETSSSTVPAIHIKESTSSNWAGYAVATNLKRPQSGAVSFVGGTWVVPAVDPSVTPKAYSSFWVGIDGYRSGTVEQIGTSSDTSSGTAVYYAWYEMYPKYPVNIAMTISPGDTMHAEVQYVGAGKFQLTLADTTTGQMFSTVQKSGGAKRSSAEWIAEAPSSASRVLPLADFGTVTFTGASATLNGQTGPINNPSWQYDRIDMGTSSGGLKAQTSTLSADGRSFSVTWKAANSVLAQAAALLIALPDSPTQPNSKKDHNSRDTIFASPDMPDLWAEAARL